MLLKRLYVLVFIDHDTRLVRIAGITANPVADWVIRQARNISMELADQSKSVQFLGPRPRHRHHPMRPLRSSETCTPPGYDEPTVSAVSSTNTGWPFELGERGFRHPQAPIGPDVDLQREDIRLADGTRLTPEVAEAIVDEVRCRSGRPSLSGAPSRSPQIAFRVAPEVRDRAERAAAEEGKTVSQLAREALEPHLSAAS